MNNYWENRYQQNDTGWDVGTITQPLKEYIDQLSSKNLKILIPGAGNGYEFEYLYQNGFTNIHVVDIAPTPLHNIKNRIPQVPNEQLICNDFFNLTQTYDLILEQTFFCAIDPKLRKDYVQKCYELLNPNGKIAGLLFDFPLTTQGPPYGGCAQEYLELFANLFSIKTLQPSYNSIKPRQGKEIFFIFEKN